MAYKNASKRQQWVAKKGTGAGKFSTKRTYFDDFAEDNKKDKNDKEEYVLLLRPKIKKRKYKEKKIEKKTKMRTSNRKRSSGKKEKSLGELYMEYRAMQKEKAGR